MKIFAKSVVLSLALLVSQVNAMEPAPTVADHVVEAAHNATTVAKIATKSFVAGEKVGEVVGTVKAHLPSTPVRPTFQDIKASLGNAKDTVVAYAIAHPYKATAIVAATAAVVYAVYKVCTAKKNKQN